MKESTRAYIYRVLLALQPIVVAYGLATDTQALPTVSTFPIDYNPKYNNVLLPQPLLPVMLTNSPRATERETSFSTGTVTGSWKDLFTFTTSRTLCGAFIFRG